MVQSSSITTSLVVPLAGAGVLTLRQIFSFTLGANIGTTITAPNGFSYWYGFRFNCGNKPFDF